MTDEEFERFREFAAGQMAQSFIALQQDREQAQQRWQENQEEHRRMRRELRAAVREGIGYVRETRRGIQALIDNDLRLQASLERLAEVQRITEQKLQAFIDSMQRGGDGHP